MSAEPKVVAATFSDFRVVKSRGVFQLIMEAPIENMMLALNALGQPGIATDNWCMIQPIKKPVAENAATIAAKPAENKPKRKFSELSLPEQCALRCEDGRFERFLYESRQVVFDTDATGYHPEMDTAAFVRGILGVNSRAELSTNHDAANKWRSLEAEFQRWLTDQEYADVRRP